MGWLITLGLLTALALLPLGVAAAYTEDGFTAGLLVGPFRLKLYPGKKKEKKPTKTEKPKPKPAAAATEKKGGSLTDFLPLVNTALDFLGDFRRKLRVKRLQLLLVMAGDDPCDLAVNYGKAWAAVGNLMPLLEQMFVIKHRDVQVACDFTQSKTMIDVKLEITITLGRLLGLAVVYGFRAIREYLKITNQRKGGVQS